MLSVKWRGYRQAAWVGQGLLTIAVIFAAVQGNWWNVVTLGGFLIASLVFVIQEDRLPTLFDFLFVLAALLNAAGWVWGLFGMPGLYDEIVHAFTTFAITLAVSFLVYQRMLTIFRQHTVLYLLTIASFGIAIGALWEITEWSAGKILSTQIIGSLNDTIIDLVMDTLGAIVAAFVSLWALQEWTNRDRNSVNQHNNLRRANEHNRH
ncbi:hypothetical protein ACE1B6_04815 [Aerosakkonemataceae cyanobacterium BLCC-F154]|uniref:DUF2238 domain-containing protein n=1 Tax=Floridaenema fluviatile BLCC-F154 TaxID=3153640 RepID=A0ABV4Y702_9CYAN